MTVEQYKKYLIKHLKYAIKVSQDEAVQADKDYNKYTQKETFNFEKSINACARRYSLEDRVKYLTAEIQYIKDGWIEKWGKENKEE